MGQEDGETAPFQFFTSHSDPELVAGVRRGRAAEFAAFGWDPEALPDPQDPRTFERSRLRRAGGPVRELYHRLLALRRQHPALRRADRERTAVDLIDDQLLRVHRWSESGEHALLLASLAPAPVRAELPAIAGGWQIALDTAGERAGEVDGALAIAPRSAVLLVSSPR
jgi:maltooligosyltrehalose trehalohydrolase